MGVRPTPTLTLERTQNPAVTSSIELQGLRKSFRTPAGIVEAVRGVDVVVAPGETLALLGPNGAGKSTTIDLMLGLQRPDGGTAMLFGRAPGDAVAQGRIGVMLQSGGLLRDLTVRELVTMMAALYPAPLGVDDALALAGATEIASRRTEKLSGGERQRVRFAISLVGDPELLVLDEPTAGMDVEARRRFWTAARNLAAEGRTILFATHYLEEADDYADRVVLMSRGQVVADGPPTEIKSMVGTRTIRATLPGAPLETLERLPGVTKAERRGEAIVLVCTDSDAAVRALLAEFPAARDIEIEGAGLEDAFLRLTADDDEGEPMNHVTYARFELVRTFRNRRFVIFSFGFPLVLYFLIAAPNRNETDLGGSGISAPVYFMASLAAFGAMNAVLAIGGRIATERAAGWNRQLRLTPLSTRSYFRVKVLTAYSTAVATIVVLYIAGAVLGVRLEAAHWLEMTALLLVGLVPFAALGILLGLWLTADSIGPAIGGTTALLGLLGGVWFPITSGALHVIAQALPSYWLVQAAHVGLGGDGWGITGWLVVIAWSVGAGLLAMRAYRRDTEKPSA